MPRPQDPKAAYRDPEQTRLLAEQYERSNSKRLYSVVEAARITGRAADTIREWARTRRIETMIDTTVWPHRYMIPEKQLAAILRAPRAPQFVRFPTLDEARASRHAHR